MKASSGLSIYAAITPPFVASMYHKSNNNNKNIPSKTGGDWSTPNRAVKRVIIFWYIMNTFLICFGVGFCQITLFLTVLELPEKKHWQVSPHLNTHIWKQRTSTKNNICKSACHIPNMTKGNLHEEKCSVSVYINVNNLLTNDKCMIIYSKWNEVCPKGRRCKCKLLLTQVESMYMNNHVFWLQWKLLHEWYIKADQDRRTRRIPGLSKTLCKPWSLPHEHSQYYQALQVQDI